jgi:flagellar basal-body rod protein FlgG
MLAQQLNIDTIAHNLSNVNTVGYKKTRVQFEDLFYQTLSGAAADGQGKPSPVQVGHGTRLLSTQKLHVQGSTQSTGNALDLMIEGAGFFKFTLPDGTLAYGRDGALSLDANGNIVNANGFLLEPSITVPTDATDLAIGPDGTVSARMAGAADPSELGQITTARFVNEAGLEAMGGNLYRPTLAAGDPIEGVPGEAGLGFISQGHLELSNVQVVEEMVNMIVAQRAFEVASKAIQASDEMMRLVSNIR